MNNNDITDDERPHYSPSLAVSPATAQLKTQVMVQVRYGIGDLDLP